MALDSTIMPGSSSGPSVDDFTIIDSVVDSASRPIVSFADTEDPKREPSSHDTTKDTQTATEPTAEPQLAGTDIQADTEADNADALKLAIEQRDEAISRLVIEMRNFRDVETQRIKDNNLINWLEAKNQQLTNKLYKADDDIAELSTLLTDSVIHTSKIATSHQKHARKIHAATSFEADADEHFKPNPPRPLSGPVPPPGIDASSSIYSKLAEAMDRYLTTQQEANPPPPPPPSYPPFQHPTIPGPSYALPSQATSTGTQPRSRRSKSSTANQTTTPSSAVKWYLRSVPGPAVVF